MIEGVTILNKIAMTGLPIWATVLAMVIFILGIGVFVISIMTDFDWPTWTAIFPILGLVVLIISGILNCTIKTGEYRYECTIDDSVSYNEIVENYKIIEQRGDIWVLEDKGD